jgi:hypothetical protein
MKARVCSKGSMHPARTVYLNDRPARFGGTKMAGRLVCKTCGSEMVLRTRKRDGRPFFGCRGYPMCQQTHPATPDGTPLQEGKRP